MKTIKFITIIVLIGIFVNSCQKEEFINKLTPKRVQLEQRQTHEKSNGLRSVNSALINQYKQWFESHLDENLDSDQKADFLNTLSPRWDEAIYWSKSAIVIPCNQFIPLLAYGYSRLFIDQDRNGSYEVSFYSVIPENQQQIVFDEDDIDNFYGDFIQFDIFSGYTALLKYENGIPVVLRKNEELSNSRWLIPPWLWSPRATDGSGSSGNDNSICLICGHGIGSASWSCPLDWAHNGENPDSDRPNGIDLIGLNIGGPIKIVLSNGGGGSGSGGGVNDGDNSTIKPIDLEGLGEIRWQQFMDLVNLYCESNSDYNYEELLGIIDINCLTAPNFNECADESVENYVPETADCSNTFSGFEAAYGMDFTDAEELYLSSNIDCSSSINTQIQYVSIIANLFNNIGLTLSIQEVHLINSTSSFSSVYNYITSLDVSEVAWLNNSVNSEHKTMILKNLGKYANDADAYEFIDDHLNYLRTDSEYKTYVESTFGWSGIMWSIGKELIGDKVVDIIFQFIPGFGNADEIRDAIKAAKNGDYLEFTVEIGKIVVGNTPLGKLLKVWDAVDTLHDFYKKIEKIWDKIGTYAENIIEQMWVIVKQYPSSIRVNSDIISGIAKTIKRGLKSINEVMDAIPNFTQMTPNRMKHILHGDTGGGLHHVSGLVNDPSKKVIDAIEPNTKGVYRVKYEYIDSNGNTVNKWSTMFPDNKTEIQVAKSVEYVFNNPASDNLIENGTKRLLKGNDATGIPIEIVADANYNIITSYPEYN